ncbi:MAG: hypothetical protein MUF62_11735 [Chitinophagaceae bacterium]|nr:hypothetical protein [Chitinophagaceae bacterium]
MPVLWAVGNIAAAALFAPRRMAPRFNILVGWLLGSLLLATSLPVLVQAWQQFYWKPQRLRQLAAIAPPSLTVQFEIAAVTAHTSWVHGEKEFEWNGAWYDVLAVTTDSVLVVPDHLEQQLEKWLEDYSNDNNTQQPVHTWALSMPVQFHFIFPLFGTEHHSCQVFALSHPCRDCFKPPAFNS